MGSALENYVNQVRTLSASGKLADRRRTILKKPGSLPPLF